MHIKISMRQALINYNDSITNILIVISSIPKYYINRQISIKQTGTIFTGYSTL